MKNIGQGSFRLKNIFSQKDFHDKRILSLKSIVVKKLKSRKLRLTTSNYACKKDHLAYIYIMCPS